MRSGAHGRWHRHLPLVPVACVCLWNLWFLRATLVPVAYLDDSSMHEQMVRVATHALRSGNLPLTRWFPFLGLGSPQFLHYQSGGATLTALAGLVVGPDAAFRWSLYLLVALWPIAIFASARLWGLTPSVAAVAAVVSPFLSSSPGIGYEQKAYLWVGYGVWAQLWASWSLPFAWATTWRALDDRRWTVPAVLCIAATAALHFETGYLAFGAVLVLPWIAVGPLARRWGTAVLVLVGGLATTAWVIMPLVSQGRWAAVNQVLAPTGLVRGYGARIDLWWLVTGRTFDNGRLPIVSLAVLAGVVATWLAWRRCARGRAMLCLFGGCLLLSFGPTTWGPLADVIPGHQDLFFRRFVIGVNLAGIYLAGIGVVYAWEVACRLVAGRLGRSGSRQSAGVPPMIACSAAVILGAACVAPLLVQMERYDSGNARAITAQHASESDSSDMRTVLARVAALPSGRVYAGSPGTWGDELRVGGVPVYKYLEARDVDEVGYTLRTASLMTDSEVHFDGHDPGDYMLFGVHYLILSAGAPPPVPAYEILLVGPYALWELRGVGYVSVVDVVGTLTTNRAEVGGDSAPLLTSDLLAQHANLRVNWGGRVSRTVVVRPPPAAAGAGAPGTVGRVTVDLVDGTAAAEVILQRPSVVELAVSYDPGWHATVDGHPVSTEMLAPAVIGVPVAQGAHRVTFAYQGFTWYPPLFGLAGVAVVVLWLMTRRRAPSGRPSGPSA